MFSYNKKPTLPDPVFNPKESADHLIYLLIYYWLERVAVFSAYTSNAA